MPVPIDLVILFAVAGLLGWRFFALIGRPSSTPVPADIQKAAEDAYKAFVAKNKLTFSGSAEAGLKKILAQYPFVFPDFVILSKNTFEAVMTAFAKGDTASLKTHLSPALFKSFDAEIKKRKTAGQTLEFELIRFKSVALTNADLHKSTAKLQVSFETDQVNLLKNAKGNVIADHDETIDTATDVWTFEKDMASKDAPWIVAGVA